MLRNFPVVMDAYIFLICLLKGRGKMEAALIASQARFESNDYKSELVVSCKNLFGMTPATVRKRSQAGTATKGNLTFAKYNSYYQSVLDRLYWDEQFSLWPQLSKELRMIPDDNTAVVRFVAFLYNNKYFTAQQPLYLAGILAKLANVKANVSKGLAVIGVFSLLVAFLAWFLFKKRKVIARYVRK